MVSKIVVVLAKNRLKKEFSANRSIVLVSGLAGRTWSAIVQLPPKSFVCRLSVRLHPRTAALALRLLACITMCMFSIVLLELIRKGHIN